MQVKARMPLWHAGLSSFELISSCHHPDDALKRNSMGVYSKKNRARKLAGTLPGIMRDKGWERKFDQHRVFLVWDDLVDETTAARSRPLKVVKDVLWLEVENSAWMQQLQYQKILLLETLNDYLKVSRFSDIRFAVEEKKREKPREEKNPVRFIPPPPQTR